VPVCSRCALACQALVLLILLILLPNERCESSTKLLLRDGAGTRPRPVSALATMAASGQLSESVVAVPAAMATTIEPHQSDAGVVDTASCSRQSQPRPRMLAVGIITAPTHFDRRVWIRQTLRVSDAACRGIRVLFVLGSRNRMTRAQRLAINHEERAHGDVIFVAARDWVPHAVAEKSLAWWQYAAARLRGYRWYMKTDDDSLAHLPRLERDLAAMSALGRSHYYYGVMTWRAWTPFHVEADAACGDRGDDGPKLTGPSSRLKRLLAAREAGGECAGAIGPFPFADGSLQILSADLMLAFVESRLTANFSRTHLANERPPYWTHEDAAVGYLILHSAILQALPLTYVVLSPWKHNKFWINWFPRDNPSLPDGHVVNTHKVVTYMMAMIANDAYENTSYIEDEIVCVDCQKRWGWAGGHQTVVGRVPIDKFGCCSKVV